jgi:hypothetical protein
MLTSPAEVNIIWKPKPDKITIRKEKDRTMFFMNTDMKILNKIIAELDSASTAY